MVRAGRTVLGSVAGLATCGASIGAVFDGVFDDAVPGNVEPLDIVLGDVTGDGLSDAVLSFPNFDAPGDGPGVVFVMVNVTKASDGEAVFAARELSEVADARVGITPSFVRVGDMNNDGNLDIIVGTNGDKDGGVSTVTWLISGEPTELGFVPRQVFTVEIAGELRDIAIAEYTGDSFLDVVALTGPQGELVVIRNGGVAGKDGQRSNLLEEPSPEEPAELPGLSDPTSIEPGDLDGEAQSAVETSVADNGSETVRVFSRNPEGELTEEAAVRVPAGKTEVASGALQASSIDDDEKKDLARGARGKGTADLVAFNLDRSLFTVILNDSTPGEFLFGEPVTFVLGREGEGLLDAVLGDVNGDGLADVVGLLAPSEPGDRSVIRVHLNVSDDGKVAFEDTEILPAGNSPRVLAAGDVAGTECDEVVIGNAGKPGAEPSSLRTFVNEGCGAVQPECPGDGDNSGRIDIEDLLGVLRTFNTTDLAYDTDASGLIDIEDLLFILRNFGQRCP